MLIKNFTNYNQVKDEGFWAQDKESVKKQLEEAGAKVEIK